MRHIRLALRSLRKTPFVTAIAIASLALGIGANAAIFSLFDQMLLRPLPVPAPQELVNLGAPGPKPGSTSCNQAGDCDVVFSYPMLRDLEREQTVFTGIAGHFAFGANLAVRNEPFISDGMLVSGSYFNVLQVQPALGRLIAQTDDGAPGANFVAVISHAVWQERFGGSPSAIGENINVNGKQFEIIGVTPKGFEGTTLGSRPGIYVPISMRRDIAPRFNGFENRRSYWIYLFARLKPGVTMEQARTAMNTVYAPIINDVEAPLQEGMSDATMQLFKAKQLTFEPGQKGQSSIHREARTPLFMLFGITGVVLLIACANIANLLLARGANRATEMGVRLALGANRRHLLTQLLTEAVVLALLGGLASLLVAFWTLKLIASLLPPDAVESLQFQLQPSVIGFAAVVAVSTGLIFGLFPALHSTRADLISAIRAGASQMTGGRSASRFRTALVTVQVALSMALLVSAGLFLKSLVNVSRVEIGADVDNIVTFALSPARNGYDSTRSALFLSRVEEEMAAIPGVTAVASSTVPLLAGSNWGTDVRVQGFESGPDIDSNARMNLVGAGYLSALGMTLLAGREFTTSDGANDTRVAIVNEAFAKKFNLGTDVVGKYMGRSGESGDSLNILIVGFMKDAKYSDVKDEVPPLFFTPWRQDRRTGDLYFYVRTSLPPAQLLSAIPTVMKQLDPTLPVGELKTMPQQIKENIFLDRMISILSASFALLATLLAGVGLYGVLAYTVAQRTREIGVRMALGANGSRVRGMILRQVGLMTVIGGVVGVAAALGLGRAAQSLLYGLEGHDPFVFVLAVLLLSAIALTAGYLPARRAAAVDPMHALRYD
jgi:predicted permease